MSVDRVKFQNIVESQVPDFIRDDFPLLPEFLKQYYVSQEFQSGTYDLVQNIDKYVKVEELTNLTTSTVLGANVSYTDTTITTGSIGNFTEGFPIRDGLIQIDDEIIYYEYKTDTTFENCSRGFSAVTSYEGSNTPDELVFTSTLANTHTVDSEIKNLNVLFLQKFFVKLKTQVTPGFEDRSFYSGLDQQNFILGSDSFYKSKGTDQSFEILFRALYGKDVEVIRPSEYLIRPSNANYKVTKDIVVEQYLGDPMDLKNRTLFQDSSGARGSVSNVRPVVYNGKEYYQVSLDLGYQRDINLNGTIFGEFKSNQKTKVLNEVSIGATFIDVDSTIGFPESGSLDTVNVDDDNVVTTYSTKNNNQFFNVPPAVSVIKKGTDITSYDFAYAYVNDTEKIQVKISSALKDIIFDDKNHGLRKGDIVNIQSIGIEKNTEKTRNWNLNVKSTWKVDKITIVDIVAKTYNVVVKDPQPLNIGNRVIFTGSSGSTTGANVVSIISSTELVVNADNNINLADEYTIENQTLYTNSSKYPHLSKYITNVQNIYSKFNDNLIVSSNSIPFYKDVQTNPYDRSQKFTGSAVNNVIQLVSVGDHGFYTGDAVYYTPGKVTTTSTDADGNVITNVVESSFDTVNEGVYYVKRVDAFRIKISKSRSNLFSDIFVTLGGNVTDVTFTYFDFYKKSFEPQPIYREVLEPVNKSGVYKTIPGHTGIMNNGVEILNYKSPNKVRYGTIDSFEIVNGGKEYDIINPPIVRVSDSVGTGATGITNVKGQLERIDILDTGFDYQERPFVSISGGNGINASAEVRLSSVTHDVFFNAEELSAQVSLGSSTIGFSTYHKFRDSEEVIYLTDGQEGVQGLSTASSYYAGVLDGNTIKLYKTFDDSVAGINTVALEDFGNGVHKFRSATLKNIVTSVVITNPGTGYENKERKIVGVNTALNEFTIENHGYSEKEIVRYSGSSIDGLVQGKDYYVRRSSDDKFSLSEVGTGNTSVDFYYNKNILVQLRSTGSGTFNYQPIIVSVDGVTGVSTRSEQNFSCQVQPVFRGSVESIDVTDSGVGYGSSEIINFDRKPVVTLFSGKNAVLIPVINNGQIVDILVNDPGQGYNSPPDLEIETTTGKNASLTPVLKNGQIQSVKIIKAGAGYVPDKTTIKITPAGSEVVIDANIKEWNINLFERNFNTIGDDDGILDINISDDELQYSYLYAPRVLRQNTFAISGTKKDNTIYGTPDLGLVNGSEATSIQHSPIIGWAYDGNPIYGPYGFDDPTGSATIKAMQSGYEFTTSLTNRPSVSVYPLGFFIEDYVYTNSGDLDEHNGRFCVTPDYPNGVYAYFATINTINDSTGPFESFRRPQFPYLIGDSYYSVPNLFNFKSTSNQNDYDIESKKWLRNTYRYDIGRDHYDYIFNPNKLNEQVIEVTSASLGVVESVGIIAGGSNYKIGDSVIFDSTNSGGQGARAKVSSLEGKSVDAVSVASTVFYDIEFVRYNDGKFIGFSTLVHNFDNGDIVNVSGLSSYFPGFDGSYFVGVRTDNFLLNLGVGIANTSDVGYLYINGILDYPFIRPDDILTVDQEKVRVLNIDDISGRIRVQRAVEGSTGAAHTNSSVLFEEPRKFSINVGALKTDRTFDLNEILYIDPAESVGVGTVLGTGVGQTVTFSNPGVGQTQVILEPQSIYFPNHKLKLNDSLLYTPNGGSSIVAYDGVTDGDYSLTSYQNLFAVPLSNDTFGVSANKVGLGSTGVYVGVNTTTSLLYFTNVGTGNTHKFTTDLKNVVTGEVSRNTVTVSTASTHGLRRGDRVRVDIKPTIAETVVVKYDDFNRRIVFDPRSFTPANVDVVRNSINFSGEFFKLGDKVIHTSSSPAGGLENNAMYYVVPFNDTKVRLVREKYEVNLETPNFVDLTSTGSGTLAKINPKVNTKKNNTLTFDLSDSSLAFVNGGVKIAAFDMNLYSDREYSTPFFTTGKTNQFEVVKSGTPGIDGSLKLSVNDSVPSLLYYRFDIDNIDLVTAVKSQIIIDEDVSSENTIELVQSLYNGNYSVSGVTSTTYEYSIPNVPDVSAYNSSNSVAKYTTTSKTALGSIAKIEVTDGGSGYKEVPGITSIRSGIGSNAIISLASNSIGEILSTRFEDIGYGYPSDQTLKVVSNIPEVLEVESLYSFDNIGITSSGKNYLVNPELVVLDGFTNQVVDDVDLRYVVGATEVQIIKNTNGLYDSEPTIIPINNSNGVGISSIVYTESTKKVRVYLSTQFSVEQNFRYRTGSRVLIEGISVVGTSATVRGYNSAVYNYALFDITAFDSQVGGAGAYFEYSLENYLQPGQEPGFIDGTRSSGRAIPESDFPVFDITLKPNDFFIDETVVSGDKTGIVERWNPTNRTLTISTSDEMEIGDRVAGQSSGTEVIVQNKFIFNSTVITGAGTTFVSGWQSNSGFLNDSLQRIPNNEYYQNLSYSLKSQVPIETWDDAVSSLGHVAGLAKFSDLVVESTEDEVGGIIVSPVDSGVEVVIDVISEASIHCFHDFDNVSENSFEVDGKLVSDEIIFDSKVLTDFNESIGNRALSIDDFTSEFNSLQRNEKYSNVAQFPNGYSYNKVLVYSKDIVLDNFRQVSFVSVLHDNDRGYISEYGQVDTRNLGSYDFVPSGDATQWLLRYYPIDFAFNSYDVSSVSFSVVDDATGIGTTALGNIVDISSAKADVPSGTTTTVVSIPNTYRSSKLLVQAEGVDNNLSVVEMNLVHDGTDVYLLEYGNIETTLAGLGTFGASISGSNVEIDFIPSVGTAVTVTSSIVSISDNTSAGVAGTNYLKNAKFESNHVSISASGSPGVTTVTSFDTPTESSYYLVSVEDTTNSNYESFEVISLISPNGPSEFVEYGNVQSSGSLGQIGINTSQGSLDLTYTPNASIDVEVRVMSVGLEPQNTSGRPNIINLDSSVLKSSNGGYTGTLLDVKTAFGLKHEGKQIFLRGFDGSDPAIVNTTNDSISITDHYFVTGEAVRYSSPGAGTTAAIEIASQSIPGVGVTDKLPSTVDLFVVASDTKAIKLATSASNALAFNPSVISIASTGVGAGHSITATNQNQKVLLAVDNIVQSPVVAFGVTYSLDQNVVFQQDIRLTGVTSIFSGDLLKVNDEIMVVASTGVGHTNNVNVLRARMGTTRGSHSAGDLVEKLSGEYNIVGNTVNFSSAPKGPEPEEVDVTVDPDSVDFVGITTTSYFQGRSFMRSALVNTNQETYSTNYIFDNISYKFTGLTSSFTLTNNGSNVTGVATRNPFVVLNGILQQPTGDQPPSIQVGDYRMNQQTGITSITFTGNDGVPTGYDPNGGEYPAGGLMISVGSINGLGYQPLVAAGGTVTVSPTGTITSVSIANSGSGYRAGIQTVVNVGVQTYSDGLPNIEFIGTAAISGGHIVSVAITNPGAGYTGTNLPDVIFDDPLSYSNLDLSYSPGYSGSGQGATVDIVVGQGSSVINFELRNPGFGYGIGERITVDVGGTTGIPTDPNASFERFELTVDRVYSDKFNSWAVGDLEVLDVLDNKFDGNKRNFQLTLSGVPYSIIARKGSLVDVEQTLIVFINDTLQVPGEAFEFTGGSIIKFTEPPKAGDTSKILFYKGSSGIDVQFVDIIDTVKVGDTLDIDNNPDLGQGIGIDEDMRVVTGISTLDTVFTNTYPGPGISTDELLLRPVTWCKQLVDKVIDGEPVGKDRPNYEPHIFPSSYLIQPVSLSTSIVYVDSVRPLYNGDNESNAKGFQNRIQIVSQDSIVSASATAIVSTAGTISSINITNSGLGYTFVPELTVSSPVGLGTTQRASGTVSVSGGSISSIVVVNTGTGYTTSNPPVVLIEEPELIKETINVSSYNGDYGHVVGLGTTDSGSQEQLIFDLHIPQDSFMRNIALVGTAVTISGISEGDYFTIYGTNTSIGNTFGTQRTDGSSIGVGTTALDMVYQAVSVEVKELTIPGIGQTFISRVVTNVDSYGTGFTTVSLPNLGNYSWGKINLDERSQSRSFEFYGDNGLSGITTSGLLSRGAPLKSNSYI